MSLLVNALIDLTIRGLRSQLQHGNTLMLGHAEATSISHHQATHNSVFVVDNRRFCASTTALDWLLGPGSHSANARAPGGGGRPLTPLPRNRAVFTTIFNRTPFSVCDRLHDQRAADRYMEAADMANATWPEIAQKIRSDIYLPTQRGAALVMLVFEVASTGVRRTSGSLPRVWASTLHGR